jgi:hypothetical protein
MVAQAMNIPYDLAPVELVDFDRLNQLAQLVTGNSLYLELFYLNEQVVAEFNQTFYVLDINTPLEEFSRVFNFVTTGGNFHDDVQDERRDFNVQDVYGKTFKQLLEDYQVFHLNVVPI